MPDRLGESDAQRLTERIRNRIRSIQESMDRVGGLITEAYNGRAWAALGYPDWDAYVTAEFGVGQMRLERGQRQELVVEMRSAGMSLPAIAAATGASYGTVQADAQGVKTDNVLGLDGKRYEPRPAPLPPANVDIDTGEVVDAEIVDEPTPAARTAPRSSPSLARP